VIYGKKYKSDRPFAWFLCCNLKDFSEKMKYYHFPPETYLLVIIDADIKMKNRAGKTETFFKSHSGWISRVPYILWYKRMDSPERILLNSMVF